MSLTYRRAQERWILDKIVDEVSRVKDADIVSYLEGVDDFRTKETYMGLRTDVDREYYSHVAGMGNVTIQNRSYNMRKRIVGDV